MMSLWRGIKIHGFARSPKRTADYETTKSSMHKTFIHNLLIYKSNSYEYYPKHSPEVRNEKTIIIIVLKKKNFTRATGLRTEPANERN